MADLSISVILNLEYHNVTAHQLKESKRNSFTSLTHEAKGVGIPKIIFIWNSPSHFPICTSIISQINDQKSATFTYSTLNRATFTYSTLNRHVNLWQVKNPHPNLFKYHIVSQLLQRLVPSFSLESSLYISNGQIKFSHPYLNLLTWHVQLLANFFSI